MVRMRSGQCLRVNLMVTLNALDPMIFYVRAMVEQYLANTRWKIDFIRYIQIFRSG